RFARLVCGNAGLVLRAVLEDLGIVADVTFFSVWPVGWTGRLLGLTARLGLSEPDCLAFWAGRYW
ncbi:hypothetical protein, partial [Phyllobacterium lublinensis]|uniref:hypothetical protein n=1 Tax=Phyllobacterium lublinensis TaxID=2875708 RepID=UPI001CCBB4C0